MRLVKLAAICGLFSSAPITAETPFSESTVSSTERLIEAALNSDHAYELVESLTTEIGPRFAGSPAEAAARAWAIKHLSSLGFSNVGEDIFTIPGWQRGTESLTILRTIPQSMKISAFGYTVGTPPSGLEADVAYFPTLRDLESASGRDVSGKIVFVDSYLVPTMDGSGVGVAYRAKSRAPNVAASKGAVAAIVRSIASGTDRFPHTGTFRYDDNGLRIPAVSLSVPDAEQLKRLATMGPVRAKLVSTATLSGSLESGNVIAEIPGTSQSDQIVLLGAHIDSWDLGTGAIDDGSGVAISIAAANLIKELKLPIQRTIRIVLFGAEEVTLGGAKDYAERYTQELDKHFIAIESDFGADSVWALYSNVPTTMLPMIDEMVRVFGPRLGIVQRHNSASGGEDLTFIRENGVPIASLVQDGSHYFDYHHTDNDTLDKIEPEKLRQNVAAFAAFVYLAANTEIQRE